MQQKNLLVTVGLICIGISTIGLYNLYKQNLINSDCIFTIEDLDLDLDSNSIQYKKMYKIIETKGNLDKDPYDRTIEPKVVSIFSRIAENLNFDLDNLTDHEFDIIYKKYIEYKINLHTSK